MNTVTTTDVALGKYTLHVHQSGDPTDPAVLWLHGSGPGVSALSNWSQLITELMPGFHHIAPDVLGFGDSSHPANPPRGTRAYTELRAEVTVQLLDALGLRQVHVVGNSMGGMITLQMLLTAPERFNRVVLMGSGGAPVPPTEALIKMVLFYADPTPTAMRALMNDFIYDTSAFGNDLEAVAADRVTQAVRPEVRRSHEATFDMSAAAPLSFTAEDLAAIDHEVLVMHGREDKMIPVDAAYYFLDHLDRAQLHVFPHAGHWLQLEQPERFARQAAAFLEEKS